MCPRLSLFSNQEFGARDLVIASEDESAPWFTTSIQCLKLHQPQLIQLGLDSNSPFLNFEMMYRSSMPVSQAGWIGKNRHSRIYRLNGVSSRNLRLAICSSSSQNFGTVSRFLLKCISELAASAAAVMSLKEGHRRDSFTRRGLLWWYWAQILRNPCIAVTKNSLAITHEELLDIELNRHILFLTSNGFVDMDSMPIVLIPKLLN